MSVCPNCGASGNNGKFCESCGSPLPVEQLVPAPAPGQAGNQPAPGAQPIPVQPLYQQPPQTDYQPVPVQPYYRQPGYGQPVQGYQPQPSYNPAPKKSTNGACIAGFILGLVGIFTFGIPSFIGFIVSTIGVIIAFVKKQKGKVLGIIGMILSLLMTVGVIIFFANADKISEFFSNANGAGYSFEEWLFDVSYDGKIEMISETEWIEKNSGSCLVFEADDKFKYYWDYRDLNNYYYTGTYEIYFGYEAMDVLENKYPQYGYTGSQICDDIEEERGLAGVKQFMIMIIHNDGCWIDGENTMDLKWDNVYKGYYDDVRNVMDLTYLEKNTDYTFISRDDFNPSSIVMPDLTPTESINEDLWGNELVGTVELYQGEWEDYYEYDEMEDHYREKIQKRNVDTDTVIQLTLVSGQFNPVLAEDYANEFKTTMEERGNTVSEVEETTLGGYTAYKVSAQYESGQYITAWFFIDGEHKYHYVTITYYDTDIASYEMVKNTYTYKE